LDDFCIVAGPSSQSLARKMSEELRAKLVNVESKTFPDGESYIRIAEEWLPNYAVLVQTTAPPQDRNLTQLYLMADRLRDAGSRVIAVVPYLAYARQHKAYLPGEAISIKVIARLLEAAGVARLITVDIHNIECLGYFSIPANSLSAVPDISEHLKNEFEPKNCVVVAPDEGARVRVETLATHLGCEYMVFSKERDRLTGEITSELNKRFQVEGKDAIILDDLISTGGTISEAAKILKGRGARRVIAVCTHAVLASGAVERMKSAGVETLIATDTVQSEYSNVSVSHTICEFIRRL